MVVVTINYNVAQTLMMCPDHIPNSILVSKSILKLSFLLSIIFYEFLVFPYSVGLMDDGKWLEIFRCKSLSRYRG